MKQFNSFNIVRVGLRVFLLVGCINYSCSSKASEIKEVEPEDTLLSTSVLLNDEMRIPEPKTIMLETDTVKKEVNLPNPVVELPQLSYDKSKLSKIVELDKMLVDAEIVKVASKDVDEMFREMKTISQTSMSGTNEDQIRAINTISDAIVKFENVGKPLAEKTVTFVNDKYTGDSEFTSRYREIYYAALEQANEAIEDGPLRRKVGSEISNTYQYGSSMSSYYIGSMIKEFDEIKSGVVGSVISSARTSLMVADYQKGKDLVNLLNGVSNSLKAVLSVRPSSDDLAAIQETQIELKRTLVKRVAEIDKAREEYRFPQPYSSGNTPANAADLEKMIEVHLKKSFYNGKDKYDVRKVVIAGPWVAVRNVLGTILYYQIDFYVANKYKDSEQGILDIDLVTGKTSGPDMTASFGSFSIGGLGDMYEKNL
jgi:hypothetical protein